MRILSSIKVNPDKIEDVIGAVAPFAILMLSLWIASGFGLTDGGEGLVTDYPAVPTDNPIG